MSIKFTEMQLHTIFHDEAFPIEKNGRYTWHSVEILDSGKWVDLKDCSKKIAIFKYLGNAYKFTIKRTGSYFTGHEYEIEGEALLLGSVIS